MSRRNLAVNFWVVLDGIITRPEINGCRAVLCGEFNSEKQRWPVRVLKRRGGEEEMLLKAANLFLSPESESEESDESVDGDAGEQDRDTSFKFRYVMSRDLEKPYRSISGIPLLAFHGASVLFAEELAHTYCHSTACLLRTGALQGRLAEAFKGTKLRHCDQCHMAWYCSRGCQEHDCIHGGHRQRCIDVNLAIKGMPRVSSSGSDAFEETVEGPAPVSKAFGGINQPVENIRMHGGKRVAKIFDDVTFEEKCTMEFLYSCGMMQTVMSDIFHCRANSLPPPDGKKLYSFPIHAKNKAYGMENIKTWDPLTGKFKSWMWRTCNEGPDLNFWGSIPARWLPNVHVVVHNAIELLQSWEPQEDSNWMMLREAIVLANLIAGFAHQKCFVGEMLTTGAPLHAYAQLLLRWVAWQGPFTHT